MLTNLVSMALFVGKAIAICELYACCPLYDGRVSTEVANDLIKTNNNGCPDDAAHNLRSPTNPDA